jgi:hypothetical protein
MAGFYDFLSGLGYDEPSVARMNARWDHVVAPVVADVKDARVLDLGSHDGRWPYAFAAAGAASVQGIEGRPELITEFARYPDSPYKSRISIRPGDFVEEMKAMVQRGETFDVVACLGVFYHTMHHYQMVLSMAGLKPKLIIIDSLFSNMKAPAVMMIKEATDKRLNTIAQADGQSFAPIGHVSMAGMSLMAESVGYKVSEVAWNVPLERRAPVRDYYDQFPQSTRRTVHLRRA